MPEPLGGSAFLFTLPGRCTPKHPKPPTAREVEPWLATIERLRDDPAFERVHHERVQADADWHWQADRVALADWWFFSQLARNAGRPR